MRLVTIELRAPASRAALGDAPALDDLRRVAAKRGWEVEHRDVATLAQFREAWSSIARAAAAADCIGIVLSGHGRTITPPGRAEPDSLLLVSDTSESDLPATAVNLDDAVADLRQTLPCPLVLVVDACSVTLRQTRGDGAPVVALLANPSGEAESVPGGGVLTRTLTRVLNDSSSVRASILTVLESTKEQVIQETSKRQRPRLTKLGDLDVLENLMAGSARTFDLAEPLLDLSVRGQLSGDIARVLLPAVRDRGDRESRSMRLVLLAQQLLAESAPLVETELRRALDTAQQLGGSANAIARAEHVLGWRAFQDRQSPQLAAVNAEALLLQALENTTPSADHLRAQVLDTLANVQASRFRWPEAIDNLRASLEIKRAVADVIGTEISRHNLASLLLSSGRFIEAREEFLLGVRTCRERLTAGASAHEDPSPLELLTSLTLHLRGVLLTMLICGAPPQEFRSLRQDLADWSTACDVLRSWAPRAPVAEVDGLLLIGCGKLGGENPAPTADPGAHVQAWQLASDFVREGTPAMPSLRVALLEAAAMDNKFRMSALATASHLYHRYRSDTTTQLLVETIDVLRGRDRSIDVPQAWPWLVQEQPRTIIDSSRWLDWGPLGPQRAATAAPGVMGHPSVTEQYLQLAAWCSGLILCHEGAVRLPVALHLLASSLDPVAQNFQMSARSAFRFAMAVARAAKPASLWGKAIQEAWTRSGGVLGPDYETIDELAGERNHSAHRVPLRGVEVVAMIRRHEGVIARVLEPLRFMDSVEIRPGSDSLDDDGLLVEAVLVNTRGHEFACGPLLALGTGKAANVYYVPHVLQRGVLDAGTARGCDYSAYAIDGVDHATVKGTVAMREFHQ